MILYTLACDSGHRFESWFRDSAAYDEQIARGLVSCAICHSTQVAKTIMAPAIVATRGHRGDGARDGATASAEAAIGAATTGASAQETPALGAPPMEVALIDERSRDVRALLRHIRDKVVSEGQDVGAGFAVEARRIHDGRTPPRQIYGQASATEARDLLEDGIMILPMPIVPDELN